MALDFDFAIMARGLNHESENISRVGSGRPAANLMKSTKEFGDHIRAMRRCKG